MTNQSSQLIIALSSKLRNIIKQAWKWHVLANFQVTSAPLLPGGPGGRPGSACDTQV